MIYRHEKDAATQMALGAVFAAIQYKEEQQGKLEEAPAATYEDTMLTLGIATLVNINALVKALPVMPEPLVDGNVEGVHAPHLEEDPALPPFPQHLIHEGN